MLLEKGDNIRNLSIVGLGPAVGGLFGCHPEYVEVVHLGQTAVYKMVSVYSNDAVMYFLLAAGDFDREVEDWLVQHVGR